jgi:hypothetical protein
MPCKAKGCKWITLIRRIIFPRLRPPRPPDFHPRLPKANLNKAFLLPRGWERGTLESVKRLLYLLLALILVAGLYVLYQHRDLLGFGPHPAGGSQPQTAASGAAGSSPQIVWQSLDHTPDGFKVDMPQDVKQIEVPAYTEQGGVENVDMIYAYPDTNTSYSVAWKADPPVERFNRNVPDSTLDMALSDALARSQTVLIDQSQISQQGFPGRQFSARNANGGVLVTRLVLARGRLYMLTAAFPTEGARRDEDVARFYNSFTVVGAEQP